MARLNAVVSSDWHFEKLKKLFPHNHIDLQIRELDKIFKYCLENGIEHLIVPGDISDTHKMSAETYIKMLNLFKKYDQHVKVYYCGGNHDFSDVTETSMDLFRLLVDEGFFENFHLFLQPEQIVIDGIVCNMIPHPHMESIEHKKPCLNFVHVTYTGASGDNGRELRAHHEFESDARDFNISGHIHKYQVLKSRRCIYHGSPYQTNFGEALPKGFIEISAGVSNNRMRVKHKFVDNKPNFRLLTETISSQSDFARLDTEPGIKYRLYVDEGVVVPGDLMLKNPNIVQLWNSSSRSKIENDVEQFRQETQSMPQIDPYQGLASIFKQNKLTKRDYLAGKSLVQEALSELNISTE